MPGQSHCTCTRRNRSHSSGLGNGLHSVSCTMMFEYDVAQRICAAYIVNCDSGFTYVIKFCPFVTGTLAELLVKAVMALELPYE